jgi:DNA-binding MarR family transcriptional regulator
MPTKIPQHLTLNTGFLLSKSAQRVREMLNESLLPLKVTCTHFGVLWLLSEEGAMSQQNACESLRIDRSTMVTLIDDLERLGYVERKPDPSDRRVHSLSITPQGKESLPKMSRLAAEVEQSLYAPLTKPEWKLLNDLLRRLL